jgi:N6-L-threonylcarbamoyladenine synthase
VPTAGEHVLVGRTRDDAAGEAYDKVATLLGLGYPGGPRLDRLAAEGNDRAVPLPVPRMTHADRNLPSGTAPPGLLPKALAHRTDFSFSGLKTAVLRHLAKRTPEVLARQEKADIAASFQRVVVGTLLDRTFEVAAWLGARAVGVAGGVSANSRLRADLAARGQAAGLPVFVPPMALATDNAAMIAAAGLRQLRAGTTAGLDLNAQASLPMSRATSVARNGSVP